MRNRNIKLFYIHELLFQFSDSMLIIVLPIFIYKTFDSISAVFMFNFGWNLLYSIIFIPIFNLAMHFKNPKYFMAMGMFFYVAALSVFGQMTPESSYLIYPAGVLFALYIANYWMLRHWFFSVNADYQSMGKTVSSLAILRMLVGFLAPIIGGGISFFVSFNVTFILGAIAGLLSIIPILMFYAPPHPRGFTLEKIKKIWNRQEMKEIRPAYFWEGINFNFGKDTWPIAFAIFVGSILDLGLLVGMTTLIAAVMTWQMGKWFDQRKRKHILQTIMPIRAACIFLYATVYFLPNIIYVWLVEAVNRVTLSMRMTVTDSYLYAYSNKIHPIHFNLNRELALNISRFIGSGILAIAFMYLPPEALWPCMAISAVSTLGWLKLAKADHLLH